jgi:putative SOS response-associated peptidase YedK
VPITGYYEWKDEGEYKQPYYYQVNDQEIFALAGLTAEWHDKNGNELLTFTVITTEANELAAQVHKRMPVILKKEDEDAWLDPNTPMDQIEALMQPFDPGAMVVHPVSREVGNSKNNAPSLLLPLTGKDGEQTPENSK